MMRLLQDHGAVLFAAAIPRGVKRPPEVVTDEFLRKDQVFLFERYFYFPESRREHGLLVMDETEKQQDARFVSSDMSYGVQAQVSAEKRR